jgi:hypothetical protein
VRIIYHSFCVADGALDREEFAVAFHLCKLALQGECSSLSLFLFVCLLDVCWLVS